jgi:hypothetical protein
MVLLHAVHCALVSVVVVRLVERVVVHAGEHVVLVVVQHNRLALVTLAGMVLDRAAGIVVLEEEMRSSVAACRPEVAVGSFDHQAELDNVALARGSRFAQVGLNNVSMMLIRSSYLPSSSILRTKERIETFAKPSHT